MSKNFSMFKNVSVKQVNASMNSKLPVQCLNNSKNKTSNPLNQWKEIKIDEHLLEITDVVSRYDTNLKRGLTEREAQNRLIKNGLNQLTPPKKVPEWIKFLKQLTSGFSILLWVGSLLCIIVYVVSVFRQPEASKDNVMNTFQLNFI